ncbi:hypothetical protein SteCoe_10794 [Stentor coeruleus]|uniref:Uncharacterized protein n=1 Tax=Stentor coeruleus TaxID=5963 RepID=A0A1R2CEN3_9CILI|nr:hypothetical protein SteCoe_10794 [Stentor coeruleus]
MSRPFSSSMDTSINKGNAIDLKPLQNYTGNLYKIRSGPNLPDTKLVSKVCPKKIFSDKERLYEENINLKQMYNYINDENIRLKTKILQLEKCIEHPKQQENLVSVNTKPTHLIESLKQSIRDLKTEIKAKDKEIEDMKRYVRYTKMQELEGENMQYSNECMRLKRIIDELLEEKGIIHGGLNAYEKLKLENEEFRKSISNLKESDKAKGIKIEELSEKVRELGKIINVEDKQENHKVNSSEQVILIKPQDEEKSKKVQIQDGNQKKDRDVEEEKEKQRILEKNIEELKGENLKLKQALERQNEVAIEKTQEIEDLRLLLIEKEQVIESSNLQESFSMDKKQTISVQCHAFCEKVKEYLLKNAIDSKQWVKSISSNDIVSKNDLVQALDQDDILVTDFEVEAFMEHYGENDDQILSTVLVDLFFGCEKEVLTLDEIFEVLKAKSTYYGLKSLKSLLDSSLGDDEITEESIKKLFSQGIFDLGSLDHVKMLCEYFLNYGNVVKEKFVEMFEEKFEGWTTLKKTEIEGIVRRFQGLLFDNYEVLISRMQEKTRYQSYMQMTDFIQELKINGLINSSSEETCAKAISYFYSKSIKKIHYLQILNAFYDGNVDEGFMRYFNLVTGFDELKRSQTSFWISETNRSIEKILEESHSPIEVYTLTCDDKSATDHMA